MVYVEGDKELAAGNASLRVKLSPDGKNDALRMRVPAFLRHLSGGQKEVEIAAPTESSRIRTRSGANSYRCPTVTGAKDGASGAHGAALTPKNPLDTGLSQSRRPESNRGPLHYERLRRG
jgi:hypothetical protein